MEPEPRKPFEPEQKDGQESAHSKPTGNDTVLPTDVQPELMDPEFMQPELMQSGPVHPGLMPPPQPAGRDVRWVFLGPQGLRAGWSVLIFIVIYVAIMIAMGTAVSAAHLINRKDGFTPKNMFFNELIMLIGLLVAAWVMTLIERRRLIDYNLTGARRTPHFFSGLAVGFAALSLLIGSLAAGGWLHFGGAALSGVAIARWGLFWGVVFLMTGFVEEGTFRCYLQYTFTRGVNFWWALGFVAFLCAVLVATHKGNGVWGDYVIALLGLIPCFWLHVKRAPSASFWQAAWATSVFFGFVHTGNGGENWIGIFSAAAIGFVFCVSIRVTGSAWWAIGCHAGWDWGETYFYGTADSGLVAKGHFLSTTPAGNPLWSGGADGPEGSMLILGILVLLILWLVVVYGRRDAARQVSAVQPVGV